MVRSVKPVLSSISGLVALLGEPARVSAQWEPETGPRQHCSWSCGCRAENGRGYCFELGWELVPCAGHDGG